jgi:hypothetical protein
MTDKGSQRPVPPLDAPERFAGARWSLPPGARLTCPSTPTALIVVRHAGERQTFSVHEVAHN